MSFAVQTAKVIHCLVVGGGLAAMATAFELASIDLDVTVLLESDTKTPVEALTKKLHEACLAKGVQFKNGYATRIALDAVAPTTIICKTGERLEADVIVLTRAVRGIQMEPHTSIASKELVVEAEEAVPADLEWTSPMKRTSTGESKIAINADWLMQDANDESLVCAASPKARVAWVGDAAGSVKVFGDAIAVGAIQKKLVSVTEYPQIEDARTLAQLLRPVCSQRGPLTGILEGYGDLRAHRRFEVRRAHNTWSKLRQAVQRVPSIGLNLTLQEIYEMWGATTTAHAMYEPLVAFWEALLVVAGADAGEQAADWWSKFYWALNMKRSTVCKVKVSTTWEMGE
uniref:FAD/NAD(P)-binding domain-containing protein n=1 Tax=Mycena chlorophos TaxID=658473 RepID=A0ABQ0L7R8_MYCCL|nr:predicted protein [Mycena chlorophos]